MIDNHCDESFPELLLLLKDHNSTVKLLEINSSQLTFKLTIKLQFMCDGTSHDIGACEIGIV